MREDEGKGIGRMKGMGGEEGEEREAEKVMKERERERGKDGRERDTHTDGASISVVKTDE